MDALVDTRRAKHYASVALFVVRSSASPRVEPSTRGRRAHAERENDAKVGETSSAARRARGEGRAASTRSRAGRGRGRGLLVRGGGGRRAPERYRAFEMRTPCAPQGAVPNVPSKNFGDVRGKRRFSRRRRSSRPPHGSSVHMSRRRRGRRLDSAPSPLEGTARAPLEGTHTSDGRDRRSRSRATRWRSRRCGTTRGARPRPPSPRCRRSARPSSNSTSTTGR